MGVFLCRLAHKQFLSSWIENVYVLFSRSVNWTKDVDWTQDAFEKCIFYQEAIDFRNITLAFWMNLLHLLPNVKPRITESLHYQTSNTRTLFDIYERPDKNFVYMLEIVFLKVSKFIHHDLDFFYVTHKGFPLIRAVSQKNTALY